MPDEHPIGPPPEPAWAYSYIRLSSKRQANVEDRNASDPSRKPERDGYRRQVQLREDYLARNPHLTLNTSLDLNDIGVSGFTGANAATDSRLDIFQKAVADGRVPKGSYLLVESLDRFSRDEVDIAQHMLLGLMRAGIIIVSLTDKRIYRSGLSGAEQQASFIFSVMTLMRAHEESRIKSERLQATWTQKRAKIATRKLTARVPGWLRKDGDGFVEVKKRVEVVRRIMQLLADGFGRDFIARVLNADPDPEKRPWGHGTQWHGGTVQKITDNRALIGEFQPHKLVFERVNGVRVSTRIPVGDPIPDYFPRVIDEKLWDKARAVANKRRMGRAPNAGGRQGTVISNLFGMVATCAVCGKPMTYRDRGPRSTPVLRCTGERAGTCWNTYRIPYQDTENAVLSWLVTLDLSGGARGEIAKLDEELQAKVAKSAELKTQGEGIVRRFGALNEYAEAPLREIDAARARLKREIADISAKLTTLRARGARDERVMAVGETIRLARKRAEAKDDEERNAADEETHAIRTRVRQVIRNTVTSMYCHDDGHIDILTVDGGTHRFRDGYWWNEEARGWIPWAGSMFGMGYQATKAELRRRAKWLAEAEAKRPPRRWDPDRKIWIPD
ncbi:recombinase family protein [Methylobacterium sp. sgz302541]|uniref:recombinase family protein n=1 Tax=unclassified Methylobacterium TaxID=2615210 RepID=UPI003D34C2C4